MCRISLKWTNLDEIFRVDRFCVNFTGDQQYRLNNTAEVGGQEGQNLQRF